MNSDHERYARACVFPGVLDENAVEEHLARFLAAAGVSRKIVRLGPGWSLSDYPTLEKQANEILDEVEPAMLDVEGRKFQATRAAQGVQYALNALDHADVREALIAFATQVAYEAVGTLGPGVCHMTDDEIDGVALWDARRALVIGAGRMSGQDLNAIANEGVRGNNERHRCLDYPLPSAARAALDARDAAGAVDSARTRLYDLVADRKADVIPDCLLHLAGCASSGDLYDANSVRINGHAGDALYAPLAARDARPIHVALANRARGNASATGEALRAFAAWYIQACGWEHTDLALVANNWFGAYTGRAKALTRPLLDAFFGGAWIIHWTEDTLFWAAKPKLHFEENRRLHRTDGPAFESDLENLYFWHGVRVAAFVVTRPDCITVSHIDNEWNIEIRRVMIERMGIESYIRASGVRPVHHDECGTLYRREQPDDEPLMVVKVINSTREPDGRRKECFLRVPPTITSAKEAVAWTFGLKADEYRTRMET